VSTAPAPIVMALVLFVL